MNVLVVNSDAAVGQRIADLLGPAGYRVDWAAHAEVALQMLEKEPVDAVLIAPELRGASGAQLIDLLRGSPKFARLPVVVTTGLSERQAQPLRQQPGVRVLTRARLSLEEVEAAFIELGLGDKLPRREGGAM